MPNNIFHKRSLTPGSVPTTSSLNVGEIAINVPDGKIFVEKSGSTGQSVETVLVSNTTTDIGVLTLSGSLILSGSGTGSVLDVAAGNVDFDFDTLSFSGSASITGSLRVTGGITGSLLGTSSYATTALSSSYATTALSSSYALSASYSTIALNASMATSSSYAVSASWAPRNLPAVQSVTSSASVTPTSDNDLVVITAQAVALTLVNPTGTWVQGQALMVRIKDNATARAITWDTNYRAIGVTLPTTTTLSKTTYVGLIYNSTDTKWDAIGVVTQA